MSAEKSENGLKKKHQIGDPPRGSFGSGPTNVSTNSC